MTNKTQQLKSAIAAGQYRVSNRALSIALYARYSLTLQQLEAIERPDERTKRRIEQLRACKRAVNRD